MQGSVAAGRLASVSTLSLSLVTLLAV